MPARRSGQNESRRRGLTHDPCLNGAGSHSAKAEKTAVRLRAGSRFYLFGYLQNLASAAMESQISAMTKKTPSSPLPSMGRIAIRFETFCIMTNSSYRATRLRIMPPAITEATCPETFAPTACISRKFCLSSCWPIL